jgi:hypothetical protein
MPADNVAIHDTYFKFNNAPGTQKNCDDARKNISRNLPTFFFGYVAL